MTVKLFQDAGGTIPAVLAGQPVGFIKRTKGSDDAKQAIALSKPTYARRPWTGVHNFCRNTWEGLPLGPVTAAWPATADGVRIAPGSDGINIVILGYGYDNGEPYVDIRFHGRNTAGAIRYFNIGDAQQIPVTAGVTRTRTSAKLRLLAGSYNKDSGVDLRPFENFRTADNITVTGGAWVAEITSVMQTFTSISTLAQQGVNHHSRGVYLRVQQDIDFDFTVRIQALHVVEGEVDKPFQVRASLNDITQAGVPDLWHLYNDGGDSLNVTLPAGTYGLASIGIDRQIIITTINSDGTTPLNILRHERQLNVAYRLGAYSPAEEIAIRDHWGRKYA